MDALTGQIATGRDGISARAAYRPDVDGLRAIAVTAVILFHSGLAWAGGGFAGVDIFFVISGFLIGGIVHREIGEGRFSFTAFYARRARRIVPALIGVSLVSLGLGLVLLAPDEFQRFAASVAAALAGAANLWFWLSANYFTPDARLQPFLMTWSLGVEEQFYLLLPPLLLALQRFSPRHLSAAIVALTCGSLILSIVASPLYPAESFYLLPTRAWELGIGVALAIWRDGRSGWPLGARAANALSIAGLAAILATIGTFDETLPFPGWAALVPVLGTAALIAAEGSWINRRVLASRPLVAIGLISYSWYLWHWPLMAFVRICTPTAPATGVMAATGLLALIPAWISWRRIERPFRHPRIRRPDGATLKRYGITLAAMLAVPVAIYATHGLPARVGPQAAAIGALLHDSQGGPCLAGYGQDTPNRAPPCVTPGARRIALIGDSHAAALGSALRALAARRGLGFAQLTKASCPPLLGASRRVPQHPAHAAECARYNDRTITAVADDPGVDTVILTGFWQAPFDARAIALHADYVDADPRQAGRSSADALRVALDRTLHRLTAAGKTVIVLGDAPYLRFDPARQAYAGLMPIRRFVAGIVAPGFHTHSDRAPLSLVVPLDNQSARIVRSTAITVPGVHYAAITDVLCDGAGCRFAADGTPLFIDPEHLSRAGAEQVIARLAPVIVGASR